VADVRVDFHDARSVAIVVFLFVITTPVPEEILYRGLLVVWLRRLGWNNSIILVLGSLIFAANHIVPLGFVWGVAMILLGVATCALRLRYESLSPAWLAMPFSTRNCSVWSADRLVCADLVAGNRRAIPWNLSFLHTRSSS
jgi:membrane protease YdiL (CAAX protease family)